MIIYKYDYASWENEIRLEQWKTACDRWLMLYASIIWFITIYKVTDNFVEFLFFNVGAPTIGFWSLALMSFILVDVLPSIWHWLKGN